VTTITGMPWEELLTAQLELIEAQRAMADPETAQEIMGRVEECREQCGVVGGMLILLALEYASKPLQDRLSAVFGQMGIEAYKKAESAGRRATRAIEKMDSIESRMRDLERRIDALTPGIGIPEYDHVEDGKRGEKLLQLAMRVRKLELKQADQLAKSFA